MADDCRECRGACGEDMLKINGAGCDDSQSSCANNYRCTRGMGVAGREAGRFVFEGRWEVA
jgi:hypothetical protein